MADSKYYLEILGWAALVKRTDGGTVAPEGGPSGLRRALKTWGDGLLPNILKKPPEGPKFPEGPKSLEGGTTSEQVLYALVPKATPAGRVEGYTDLVKCLGQIGVHVLSANLFTDSLPPALAEAARAGKVQLVRMAAREGQQMAVDSSGRLVLLVEAHNKEFVSVLLAPGIARQKLKIITRPDGDLPDVTFPALSDDANVKILRKLVSHGPNIEHRHREGGTLLHWAVRSRDERTVALLLARDSRVAVDARTRDGRTPLRLAVDTYTWSPDIIRGLLDRGADVNAADAKGVTPFLVALRMHGVTDVPHWLIEKGADVTARGALELAAEADPRYLARILDNLDLTTNRGSFLELFRSGGQEAVRMLFDHGFALAPEDAKDIELLHAALRLNQRHVVEDLVSWGAIAMAPPGVTRDLLARAIDSANLTAIEWLFGIDEGLSSGFALEKAIVARNASVVETVLRVGDLRLAGVFEGAALESLEDLEVEDADELREVICRHVVLVATAGLEINQGFPQYRKDELPEWVSESVPASFLVECVAEVAFLRSLRVGDSSATFYDVLNASSAGMARLLKDPVVRGTLESRSFATEFPRFWPLVDARVRSGGRRRDLVDRGVEGFGSLAPQCHRLPFHLRERIFGYLRNHELLVLIEACRLGKGENDTDPR